MNVQYKGRKTVDAFGEKLARPFDPVAIVSFSDEEYDTDVAILE